MTKNALTKTLTSKLALLTALLFGVFSTFAQTSEPWSQNNSPLPPPTGFVNDYANVIDAATKARLEKRLKEFRDTSSSSAEIAVAVVRTTGERPIFDYSLAVARGWKIGSKADDNPGALLLVAIDDRKYFTQVSKDLEDELSDGTVGSLQRQYLVPEFRKGNYAKGIEDTVNAYIAAIEGKTVPGAARPDKPVSGNTDSGFDDIFSLFCCAVIIFIILIIILSRSSGGGGGGGVADALPWVIGGILNSSGGGSSSSSDWGGSSGGSDWGGFGGGGDFGGGGAGGDW